MQDGQKYVAIIQGFHMIFRGNTAIEAKKRADDFRLTEALRTRGSKFPPELLERAQAATAREAQRALDRKAKAGLK